MTGWIGYSSIHCNNRGHSNVGVYCEYLGLTATIFTDLSCFLSTVISPVCLFVCLSVCPLQTITFERNVLWPRFLFRPGWFDDCVMQEPLFAQWV